MLSGDAEDELTDFCAVHRIIRPPASASANYNDVCTTILLLYYYYA
jgi:hypothetical protein